jgi:hypothetical protein
MKQQNPNTLLKDIGRKKRKEQSLMNKQVSDMTKCAHNVDDEYRTTHSSDVTISRQLRIKAMMLQK